MPPSQYIELLQSNRIMLVLTLLTFAMIVNLIYVSQSGVSQSYAMASSLALFIPIVGIIVYTLFNIDKPLLFKILALVIVGLFGYISLTRNVDTYIVGILQFGVLFSIAMLAFALVTNITGQIANRLSPRYRFFYDIIVYIPCLFGELVEYMKNQIGITSSNTFAILAVESVLIGFYFIIPGLFKLSLKASNGIVLIDKPVFLDTETRPKFDAGKLRALPNINQSTPTQRPEDINKGHITTDNLNYSFSMWLFLNQQTQVAGDTHVFSYADGYPKITYKKRCNVTGGDIFTVQLYKNDTGSELIIPNQKWNHLVFNYNQNKVDMFLNGNLEKTSNTRTYEMDNNIVKIGSNAKGVYGAMCNVQYFPIPLSSREITTMYNLLINKNPPINNIL